MGLVDNGSLCQIVRSKWSVVQFLYDKGVLSRINMCPRCTYGVGLKRNPEPVLAAGHNFSRNSHCTIHIAASLTIAIGCRQFLPFLFLYLEKASKQGVDLVIFFHMMWLTNLHPSAMRLFMQNKWTEEAVLNYSQAFRKLVPTSLLDYIDSYDENYVHEYEAQIGGTGITESLLT
jgi:hypothetical protein